MNKVIAIKSDADAWNALKLWLEGESIDSVRFGQWPVLNIKICGQAYHSSLNTGQMAAYVDFKQTVARAYASIAHGAYDARKLRDFEEEQLEFTTKVREGSSIAQTDYTPLIDAFAQIITSNPNIVLAVAIIMGLTFVSTPIISKLLDLRAKQMASNERQELIDLAKRLSDVDKERWEIMDRAVNKICETHPQFSQVIPDASSAHLRLAASAANADSMEISGVVLNKKELEILAGRRAPRRAKLEEIHDEFVVTGIVKLYKNYRVQLKSRTTQISAIYGSPQMSPTGVKRLMSCISDSHPIKAEVQLRKIDGSQVIGRLLDFKLVSEKASNS